MNRYFAQSNRKIHVHDAGAGSKRMAAERSLAAIYKNSRSRGFTKRLLIEIPRWNHSNTILELGTSLGFGTRCLSFGAPQSSITSVEGCPLTAQEARNHLHKLEIGNVTIINQFFHPFLSEYRGPKIDFVYLDGHHDGVATMEYIDLLMPHFNPEALVLIDDVRWNASMKQAMKQLKSNSKWHYDFFTHLLIRP